MHTFKSHNIKWVYFCYFTLCNAIKDNVDYYQLKLKLLSIIWIHVQEMTWIESWKLKQDQPTIYFWNIYIASCKNLRHYKVQYVHNASRLMKNVWMEI